MPFKEKRTLYMFSDGKKVGIVSKFSGVCLLGYSYFVSSANCKTPGLVVQIQGNFELIYLSGIQNFGFCSFTTEYIQ